MKNNKLHFKAFTLVEVLVSITIFSIMVISIIWIYIVSTDITMKSDINRMMQENIKNVTNTIAEDVRKNGIKWVAPTGDPSCIYSLFPENYKTGTKLCTKSLNEYYLAFENTTNPWNYIRATDIANQCSWIDKHCVIYSLGKWPLTNSFVSVKELNFYYSKDYIPKVTMNIVIQPAMKKWVKSNLIEESELIFQTTVSERPF